ncbi:MAG: hypothetical protein L3J08_00145 [Flavobacteriaceae bacterium]|nr:hypothetical protein [Flavobacteriaceae bacterium]
MSNKFFINCDDATMICDKSQYEEASTWGKIKLWVHLLMCKYCRVYSSQNNLITIMLGKHLNPCDGLKHLTPEEKKQIENNLNQKLER